MIARPPAPVLGAARGVLIWIAAMAGLLVAGACALNTAAVAATGAQAAHGVAAPSGLRSAGGPILVFRVDVSHYPQVGVVVTVPGSLRRLKSSDFVVLNGAQASRPSVSQLSANNVQLMLVPDTGLSLARWHEEQHAAARFLVDLPEVAQTAVVDPSRPGLLAHGLTPDATSSVARLAGLPGGTPSPAARLAAALSGFSRGSRVRRTVVLVVSSPSPLAGAAAARFREQLAASGTALYVIDATPRRDPGYDALAAGSGGRAIRVRSAAEWPRAFGQILSDLGEQYYLRFTDTGPRPGRVKILVRTALGIEYGVAGLPAVNPTPPPPLRPVKPPAPRSSWDRPLVWLAALLVIFGVGYGLLMLVASRKDPRRRKNPARHAVSGPPGQADGSGLAIPSGAPGAERTVAVVNPPPAGPGGLFFVFLMPCLNEEKVILGSLQRLLSMPGGSFVVLVIDDGSDDATAEMVAGAVGEQVWLLSRQPPDARQGKGEALNAAIRFLTGSGRLAGHDPDEVIVVVVDADGRLDPHAVSVVGPYFADPTIGAVQIGVRINNRDSSRLARMQDMEFVIYTEVFQRGRRHLGSVGLGGNGQFMRLSALLSLGGSPWTRSLTDDLDLGVRLLVAGWRNEYCSAAAVHQQGVVQLRRLIRQRSRWFQGHLQSWTLIPLVLRSAPRRARGDLLYHLSSPAILLIASLLSASFLLSLANCAMLAVQGRNPFGWWIASTYALTFGSALAYGLVYWGRERRNGVSLPKVVWLAHLYVCYGMIWYASGWWAVVRTLRGHTGWAKTDRIAEAPTALAPAAAGASASTVPAGLVTMAAGTPAGQRSPAVQGRGAPPGPVAPGPVEAVPADAAPGRAASRSSGRRQRRVKVLTIASALVCATVGAGLAWSAVAGHGSGHRQWLTVFNGYGHSDVTGSGAAQTITIAPARTRSRRATHSALVVSRRRYGDFVATVRVQTLRQLRHGAAGTPHPWEVGWVVWHYTSDQSFYALTLEPTGWLLSKQDPSYPGGERFLASGRTPLFRVGVPHSVGIVQVGDQITVSGDGHLLTRFTDTRQAYLRGSFGAYSEDSDARFSDIRVRALPVPAPGFGPVPVHGRRGTPEAHLRSLRRGNSDPGRTKRHVAMSHSEIRTPPAPPPAGAGRQIMVIYGTRPEAVKVAPLIRALDQSDVFTPVVAVTAQHRSMLDQVNEVFDVKPSFDLDIHRPGQTLTEITTRALAGVQSLLAEHRPDAVVVQGDTTTAVTAALAAFYEKIPVVHLEAGLRTGDPYSPYPEEINRRLTTRLTALHLAPTGTSKANLLAENVDEASIVVTGNTVIDALLWAVPRQCGYDEPALADLDRSGAPVLLVTAHRRESWGAPLGAVGRALARIAAAHGDLRIVFPVHCNPAVRDAVLPAIRDVPNVIVTEPLPYGSFCRLMSRATVILTDSGGVQEEAPSLGKPVLVMRDTTERPEAVRAGTVKLVGTDEDVIVDTVGRLLTDPVAHAAMANAVNPYGDGRAAQRAVAALAHHFRLGPAADEFDSPAADPAAGRREAAHRSSHPCRGQEIAATTSPSGGSARVRT